MLYLGRRWWTGGHDQARRFCGARADYRNAQDLLPPLSHLAGPIQHFKAAVLDAWRKKVAADLCGRKGFRGGPLLDVHGSLQLLNSSHVRERDKVLLRSILVGCVWNGLLLGRVRSQVIPCRFCGAPDGDGHLLLGMNLSSSC